MIRYIFDFDRVLYNTPLLIARAREKSSQILGCEPRLYDDVYKSWSDYARGIPNSISLSEAEQQKAVSWLHGFVPYLAKELTLQNADDITKVQGVLHHIHVDCLNQPQLYKDVMTMVEILPKEHVYIFTAGGVVDQKAKLRASGIYSLLDASHIQIVPAKTQEIFQELLTMWRVSDQDGIIHTNDRLSELRELQFVHPKTESVWATWAWPGIETPHDMPPQIHRVDTLAACRSLLVDLQLSREGYRSHHENSM